MTDAPVRPASTLILLRDGREGIEVLMGRRTGRTAFAGGAYVFPGGAVDAEDRRRARELVDAPAELRPWVGSAVRETAEEVGLVVTEEDVIAAPTPARDGGFYDWVEDAHVGIGGPSILYLSNWVTPAGQPKRFDTRFFVARADDAPPPQADGSEIVEATWIGVNEALDRHRRGLWPMIFPTIKHLELLAGFADVDEVLAHAVAQTAIPRIEPRVLVEEGRVRIVLPGEPGFDA